MKPTRFFFHYNKNNKAMTIHFKKACSIVKNIKCNVPTNTKWNINRQPYLIVQGFARSIEIKNNLAVIN